MKLNKKYKMNFLLKHLHVLSRWNNLQITFFFIFNWTTSFGTLTGDFRSVNSGDWNSYSTWEIYNGSFWIPAFSSPSDKDGEINICSGNYINISENVSVDQFIISAGGQLQINESKILSVINSKGVDMVVEGTLFIDGTLSCKNSSDIIVSGMVLVKPNGKNIFESGSGLSILKNGTIRYMDKMDDSISFSSMISQQSTDLLSGKNLIPTASKNLAFIENNETEINFSSSVDPFYDFGNDSTNQSRNTSLTTLNIQLSDTEIILTGSMDLKSGKDRYAIERSFDGIHFFELDLPIETEVQSDLLYFKSFDRNPIYGKGFYRVKHVNSVKEINYSDVIMINHTTSTDYGNELKIVSLLENPFTRNFELDFVSPEGGSVDLALLNSSGKRICYDKINVADGFNTYEFFKKHSRNSGISFVTISSNDQMVLEKIQKH